MTFIYYSFLYSYSTYGNIVWCSTTVLKLKKLLSKQRQAIKTISVTIANVECKLKEIMGKIRKLNLYKIVLQQVLTFAFLVKVLCFVFKNFKSAFDIFKKINSQAYLEPP